MSIRGRLHKTLNVVLWAGALTHFHKSPTSTVMSYIYVYLAVQDPDVGLSQNQTSKSSEKASPSRQASEVEEVRRNLA